MKNNSALWTNSITYGLLTGLVSIILALVLYFLDLTFSMPYLIMVINIAIFVAGIYIGTKVLRDQHQGGQITYGRAFGSGVLISLFTGILGAIFTYILYTYIDAGLMEKYFQYTEEKMLAGGKATEEQVEVIMTGMRGRLSPLLMALGSIPGNVFFGLIISLITSAILKKDSDSFASAMSGVESEQK